MEVKAIGSDQEISRFVGFAERVYQNYPCWVPHDEAHLADLISGRSAFCVDADIQAFWVEEDGNIIAEVTMWVDYAFNKHWNETLAHALFFEALPNRFDAVLALFETATAWAARNGTNGIRMAYLYGRQLPMTIDAYDKVPSAWHGYNPPYYHSYLKAAGFVSEEGCAEYQVTFSDTTRQVFDNYVTKAENKGVSFRTFDFDDLEKDTKIFSEMHNLTFANHWGAAPITPIQMADLTIHIKDLIVPDIMLFAEVDGAPAGFVYCLPDFNQAFHKMRGKKIEDHQEEFQKHLAAIDHGILLIVGVKKEFRGRSIAPALSSAAFKAMMGLGYKSSSYTLVIEANLASQRAIEKMGGFPARNFMTYRKPLT